MKNSVFQAVALSCLSFLAALILQTAPARAQDSLKTTINDKNNNDWVILGKRGQRLASSLGANLNRGQLEAMLGEPVKSGTREFDVFNVITSALKGQSKLNQLSLANRFYNQQPYKTDDEVYGVPDHWATVGEFLANGGDCEDYALAKYRTLIRAGFPESELRIVLLNDTITHNTHAVLAARVGQTTYIMDNQAAWLRPETSVTYYHPIYSLNGSGIWYHGDGIPDISPRQITVTGR